MAYEALNANPYAGLGGGSYAALDGNIFGNIIREFGRDISGTVRVIGATGGEMAEMLGIAAPLTYEDLETRDYKGALMLAALGTGGLTAGALRGIPAIANIAKTAPAIQRATTLAGAEAVAGAAMGLIRPLEDDESRMRAVVGDAAWTAGFGAGFSLTRSAWKATLGGQLANIKQRAANVSWGQAAKALELESAVKEHAGVVLLNPDTASKQVIRRLADGKVQVTSISKSGATTRETASDFGGALAKSVSEGYTENTGLYTNRLLKSVEGQLDDATKRRLAESNNALEEVFGKIHLTDYAEVRKATKAMSDAGAELGSLAGEVLAPTNKLGVPALAPPVRATLLQELRLSSKQAAKMTDSDLLRAGFREGLLDINTVKAGVDMDQYMKDLFLSDLAPDLDMVVNHYQDSVLVNILTPATASKLHPNFAILQKEADNRLIGMDNALDHSLQKLSGLRQRLTAKEARAATDIIDGFRDEADLAVARSKAVLAAKASGNRNIEAFVTDVTDILGEYLERGQAADVLGEGLSGYFPMTLANKWRLNLKGISVEDLAKEGGKLFYPTKKAAKQAVKELQDKGYKVSFSLSPQSFSVPGPALTKISPAAWGKTRKALIEAYSEAGEDASKLADEALEGLFRPDVPPKKGTPFAKKRTLGIRDLSKDPFDALEMYIHSMERTIAMSDFERFAKPLIDGIPDSQSRLKAAATEFVDDMMGRPRWTEDLFQGLLEKIGYDAPPRALKKYAGALRRFQSAWRLSGPWSAAVNLSQIALNTNAVLGTRWTARGFEAISGLKKYNAIQKKLHGLEVPLGHAIHFTDEANMAKAFGGPAAAFKERRYMDALFRSSLFMFHGAEKVNRIVTAWGAFKKGLAEGMDEKQAAGFAKQVLERTQFNYRYSNIPAVLRDPAFGVMFQFKSFVINEVEFIASLSGAEARRFGATVFAMGGLSQFINMPGGDLLDVAGHLYSEKKLSEQIALNTDDSSAKKLAFYGVPGLFDVNISEYVGVGNIADITRSFFGPSVSDFNTLFDFAKGAAIDMRANGFISPETSKTFIQKAMPPAIRRVERGYNIFATGEVRNPYSGKLVYKPASRMRSAMAQGVGLPELEMAQERAADAVAARVRDNYLRGRTAYAKKAAQAIREGNQAEARIVVQEAAANGFNIDERTLRYWTRELGKPASERRRRLLPTALRDEYEELFEATGGLGPLP